MNNKAVFGIVKNLQQAEKLVNELKKSGFINDDISVLYSEKLGGEITEVKSEHGQWTETNQSLRTKKSGGMGHEKGSKAPEGAATGATAGGIIGGTLGLLAGIGALAIPGFGPFIAAGPIMAALAGSAVGGSVGLLTGALVGLGIPEYEAVHYVDSLKQGNNILISVHTNSSEQIDTAKNIFQRCGATDISSSRETTSSSRGGKR